MVDNRAQGEAVSGTVSYAILDQALWHRFRSAATPDEFIGAWLAILCRQLPGAVGGTLLLGPAQTGPFVPACFWPDAETAGAGLAALAQTAAEKRQSVTSSAQAGGEPLHLMAAPILVGDHLYGACAVSFTAREPALNEVMRKLHWALGWVEVHLRRAMEAEEQQAAEHNRFAFDMLASVLEAKGFHSACSALVTEMAMRLGCDPVAVGFVRRKWCRVAAISHSAGFANKLSLVRDIGAAMDEAVDQAAVVAYPAKSAWDYRVSLAHRELVTTHKGGSALTLPLQSNGAIVGAITLQRPRDKMFDEPTVALCDAVAAVVGPVLDEKRRNDRNILRKLAESAETQLKRLLGPSFFGRKIATVAALAAAAYLSVATVDYSVTSPAVVRGTTQRTVVAPFSGYVFSESARSGEVVRKGQVLAQLDEQDLTFERLRLITTREQKLTEYDRALARQERAEALIVKTQIEQTDAQLALIEEQLRRTRLTAPFDGLIVEGDLSQSVGATVERGQELFRIAPLDSYRVVLEVDESDIDEIQIGQRGQLRVAALPQQTMVYSVERITAISKQKDGRNFFLVEAALEDDGERLRPGMEGIAKTFVAERLLVFAYTHKMIDWFRLQFWRWTA